MIVVAELHTCFSTQCARVAQQIDTPFHARTAVKVVRHQCGQHQMLLSQHLRASQSPAHVLEQMIRTGILTKRGPLLRCGHGGEIIGQLGRYPAHWGAQFMLLQQLCDPLHRSAEEAERGKLHLSIA